MSASMLLRARTILSCWRLRLAAFQAPRGPVGEQEFTAMGLPARSLKDVQAPGWAAL